MGEVIPFGKYAFCEACGRRFFDSLAAGPHCCPECEQFAADAMCDAAEEEARQHGFASFDDWAAAGYPERRHA